MNLCIAPVRWLQKWFVPPADNELDWRRVSFQPMLYLLIWIAALLVLFIGDPFANPPELGEPKSLFWIWEALPIVCPPAALVSLWMVVRGSPHQRYFGFWLRLGADSGVCAALTTYCVLRFALGDFHIFPIAALLSCTLFVFHLVLRDIRTLREVEKLATVLHREDNHGAGQ